MINFLEQYHEASHLQERPNVWKRWVLLINMVPCKWQQAWDNFTIFSIVELRIKYCNLISRKKCLFWKNLQCFLVTLSFNMSTLIKRAFLKKTATTFYHYSGLTAGPITLLNINSVSFRRIFYVIPLYLGSLGLPWLASDGPIIRIIYDQKFILLSLFCFAYLRFNIRNNLKSLFYDRYIF